MARPENEWKDHFGEKYTSSERLDWQTPDWLFVALDAEFQFDVDAAATSANTKCKRFIGPDHPLAAQRDALQCSWAPTIKNMLWGVWLNPPYGRDIGDWYAKAYEQSRRRGVTVVMLVNANTETTYWEKWAKQASEIRFISGRVGYDHPDTGESTGHMQTKGSAIVIFRWISDVPHVSWVKRAELQARGEAIIAARAAKLPPIERSNADFIERRRRGPPPAPTKKITPKKAPPPPQKRNT